MDCKQKHPDYNSPAELKQILDINGFSMQKKFGQNFLINEDARKRLIDALDINEGTSVWEVGPGLGAMTCEILERGADLSVFEIDRGFAGLISQFFQDYTDKGRFHLIEGDVLKTWKKHLNEENQGKLPDRFFGNLPYNIAATLIADTIENNIRFDKCVFTVQKEVALRMAAKPGSEDYSSFSVLCQWAYDVKPLMDLGGGNFWPRPNVDSRALLLTKKENFPNCSNPQLFVKVQRALFSSRRKNVRNNLSNYLKNNDKAVAFLNAANIDLNKRAEVLTIEEVLRLSDIMDQDK
ncbi:MAG: 16S rRNA (adenine(1518)-N(6)/adenine(1519)-N(6))-dimethyltransferase RsmA [Treponema sp.]|nr:16S rRNA (adenine(1518)-N(6)/adenine(1519)-N(6))-dimethyltransferase RsmA [Treponema sp.]